MATLIEDDFTGEDNAFLGGRAPDTTNTPGHTWVDPDFTWQILLSGQTTQSYVASKAAVIDSDVASCTVTVQLQTSQATVFGLVLRSDGTPNNRLECVIETRFAPEESNLAVYKVIAGVRTLVDSVLYPFASSFPYTLVASLDGNNLHVESELAELDLVIADLAGNEFVGIWSNNAGFSYFTHFKAEGTVVADTITLTKPAAPGTHYRAVRVEGTYEGAPTTVEAQFGAQGWKVIDPAPAGLKFGGWLHCTAGGPLVLAVRWGNNPAVTDSQADVTVTFTPGTYAGVLGGHRRKKRGS